MSLFAKVPIYILAKCYIEEGMRIVLRDIAGSPFWIDMRNVAVDNRLKCVMTVEGLDKHSSGR